MSIKHKHTKLQNCKHSATSNNDHNVHKRGHVSRISCIARMSLAALLSCVMVLTMTSCKPTDFFTEIIISPFAETVWEDAPDKMVINSPDAEKESGDLSAINWTEESPRSEEVQNITLYSDEPTSTFTTHHSIFDMMPLFEGALSSDGVRLSFEEDSEEEHESDADEQDEEPEDKEEEIEATSAGGQALLETLMTTITTSNTSSNSEDITTDLPQSSSVGTGTGGAGTGGTGAGGTEEADAVEEPVGGSEGQPVQEATRGTTSEPEIEPEQAPAGTQDTTAPQGEDTPSPEPGPGDDSPDEDTPEGEEPEPSGGPNFEEPFTGNNDYVYNPGSANITDRINKVQHLAVLGTDAAVMVQSLGGKGAICAMSVEAYDGISYDSAGYEAMTYSSFKQVFADELADNFEQTALLWANDGSSPSDLVSIDILVEACGQDGVIIYDQSTIGYYDAIFSYEQREAIYNAGIQLIPVDFSSVQGILDAAEMIGKALEESEECEQDASAMAQTYEKFLNDIVVSLARTHGGSLGGNERMGVRGAMTEYNSLQMGTLGTDIFCYIVTGWEMGLTYTGNHESDIDTSGIFLFVNENTWTETPLYFWEQVAGVLDGTAYSYAGAVNGSIYAGHGFSLIFPLSGTISNSTQLSGGGNVYWRWINSDYSRIMYGVLGYALSVSESVDHTQSGLGSDKIPYYIVCGSNGWTVGEVKDALVNSMASYSTQGIITPYAALPYDSNDGYGHPRAKGIASYLGQADFGSTESPFYSGLALGAAVRENPCGLLSSWTVGNMESVLEAVWLSQIYSESPVGCDYVPIVDMSNFSVNIADSTCTTFDDTVRTFYSVFYRCDLSDSDYRNIVTDE